MSYLTGQFGILPFGNLSSLKMKAELDWHLSTIFVPVNLFSFLVTTFLLSLVGLTCFLPNIMHISDVAALNSTLSSQTSLLHCTYFLT